MKTKFRNDKNTIITYNNNESYPCPMPGCGGTMRHKQDNSMNIWMECDKCKHTSYSFLI